MSSGYEMRFGGAQEAAANLQQIAGKLDAIVSDLANRINSSMGGFEGQTSAAFLDQKVQYERLHGEVKTFVARSSTSLSAIVDRTMQGEKTGVGIFGG